MGCLRSNHSEVILIKVLFFLLSDVDMFMEFFALEEQLKMEGSWFFVTGSWLLLKKRSIRQHFLLCSLKINFHRYKTNIEQLDVPVF